MKSRIDQKRLRRCLVAAREQERGRWARELHDDTLQSLGALRLQLSSARRSADAAALRSALDVAVDELEHEIANLRSLIAELRPASLDELGLEPALGGLLERCAKLHGLTLHAVVQLDGRFDPEIEVTVYRVVQEALTNAARHAHAGTIEVEVVEQEGEIAVTVADDGSGFDPRAGRAGFGLAGMHERVTLAGGRLAIRSGAQGTVIAATLPAHHYQPRVPDLIPALAGMAS